MVSLVALQLLAGLEVVHVYPEVTARRDEGLTLRVQSGAVDTVTVGLDDLQGRGCGGG